MANEGFAKPWLEFEEELGERILLTPPISNMTKQFMRYGSLMASKYTFPDPDTSVKTEDTTTDHGPKCAYTRLTAIPVGSQCACTTTAADGLWAT